MEAVFDVGITGTFSEYSDYILRIFRFSNAENELRLPKLWGDVQ